MAVQQVTGEADDPVAADGIVRPVPPAAVAGADHVGAVEGVVQAAPAGIRGVQGVSGVVHGHHELRSGHVGDLRVHVGRRDPHTFRCGSQIPDLAQERLVGSPVVRLAPSRDVPPVDLCL